MDVIKTMEKINTLEEQLGGKVTGKTPNVYYEDSKIEPISTIYGCGLLEQETYFTKKEECDKYRKQKLHGHPASYYWTVEYFGNQEELPDVIKITLDGKHLQKEGYIYSPAFDNLIYCVEKTNMLYLWGPININKIYEAFVKVGVDVESESFIPPNTLQKHPNEVKKSQTEE